MTRTELTLEVRAKLFGIATVAALLMAITGFYFGDTANGSAASVFTLLLGTNAWLSKSAGAAHAKQILSHLTVIFLAAITLSTASGLQGFAEQWMYLFPLLTFFIYLLKPAIVAVSLYSLCLLLLLENFYPGPLKVQLGLSYLMGLAITVALVYLRESRDKELKPLRRTDNLTLASTREHLTKDLETEIHRSEREGTDLTVIALACDPGCWSLVREEERDLLLRKLGKLLHQNLRLFDGYYRYEDSEFLVILPLTNTTQAQKTADTLRLRVKDQLGNEQLSVTISLGIAGSNVGDDAESLTGKAIHALSQAQNAGANRSALFTESKQDAADKEGQA